MSEAIPAPEGPPPEPHKPWAMLDIFAQLSWRVIVCTIALTILVFALVQISFVVVPVFLAVLFTSILNPLTNWLKSRGVAPGTAATLTVLVVIAVIVTLLLLVVPPLISTADNFVKTVTTGIDNGSDLLQDEPFNLSAEDAESIAEKLESVGPKAQELLLSSVGSLLPALAQLLVMLGLAIVMTGYLLRDGVNNWRWILGFVDEPRRPAINKIGEEAYGTLAGYIRGTSIVAVFNMVVITGGAWLLGLPLLLPIAIIVFVAVFLPIVGAWMATGVTVMIGLASGGIHDAVGMALIYFAASTVKSYFLAPFIVGTRVRLAPIVTLTGVMIGTTLAGITGGIVAIPLIASVSGALGQVRRWRTDGTAKGRGEFIPILPPEDLEPSTG